MAKTRGKKVKHSPSLHSDHSATCTNQGYQGSDHSDLHVSRHVFPKDGPKSTHLKRKSSKSTMSIPHSHCQKSHAHDHSVHTSSHGPITPFFSDDEEEISYMSGIVGQTVQFEYSKSKPALQPSPQVFPSLSQQQPAAASAHQQYQPEHNVTDLSSENDARRNQLVVSSGSSSAPPPQQPPPPPPPPSDKISFQEFLQSKEVAKIHDTAKKFAQLRLQQLQNDHSALTEEQRAQVHFFLENQHLIPTHATNPSSSSDPQQLASEQYAANVNAISSLATMAAAAALHNFEKNNGAVEFLSDSEAVAIANSIKLPLPPDELNNIGHFPSLSNLSNMAVKEVNEWASREIYSFVHGSAAAAAAAAAANSGNQVNGTAATQHTQSPQSKPTSLSAPSTVQPLASSSGSGNSEGPELTPEQQRFRQHVMQYDRQIQQMEQHYKAPAHAAVSSPQITGHVQPIPGPSYNTGVYTLKRPVSPNSGDMSPDRFKSDKIWDTSNAEEKERVRQFWEGLTYEERRELVKIPKNTVMQKMRELKRTNCNCLMCGKKRMAIEELESLYEAYHTREMEKLKNIPSTKPRFEDASEVIGPEIDYNNPNPDVFNFGNTLTIEGSVLTVADDLLKNNGKKFIDMMDLLQQRRQEREQTDVQTMTDYDADPIDEEDDEFTEDDGKYDEDYEDYDEEGSEEEDEEDEEDDEEEYEEEPPNEENRWDASKKLLHQFAIKMFEQRLMDAYREKVAQERQERLLQELEEEKKLEEEREAKKLRDKERKKERKRQQKLAKEEERMKQQAEAEKEQAALKERQRQRMEEAQRKKKEQQKKKDEERKRQEEERLRKLEDERKKEQMRKEKEEKEKREKEAQLLKEKKEKEAQRLKEQKEKEERLLKEKKEKEEKERLERELKEKEEIRLREQKEKEEKERLEKEELLRKEELLKKQEEERIAKEKEMEAAKAKLQHQQQLLASLRQHAQEIGASNVSVGPDSPALASSRLDPSVHEFNARNGSAIDIGSSSGSSVASPGLVNSTLGGSMSIQFGQQQQNHYSQHPVLPDGSFYSPNGIGMMSQPSSDVSKFASQRNSQSPASFSSGSAARASWNGHQSMPSQNMQFYQPGNPLSPGLPGDMMANPANSQQNFLSRSSQSSSPSEALAFSKVTSPPNSYLKRMSMSGIDSSASFMNGSNIGNIQRPHSNSSGAASRIMPNRSFASTENLLKAGGSMGVDGSITRPFSQQFSNSRPGSIFGGSVTGGTFGDNGSSSAIISEGWNTSSSQSMSSTPRRGSMWTTGSGSSWASSAPAEPLSSSVPKSGSLAASSLTSTGSITGSLNNTNLTGSLLDKRLSTPGVSDDVIRSAATKAYHEYVRGILLDGKVSSQLLYVNTLNVLNQVNGIRFNQQEFFNACEKPDENGVIYFELIRNRLGVVTHLKYKHVPVTPFAPGHGVGASMLGSIQSPTSGSSGSGMSLSNNSLTSPSSAGLTSLASSSSSSAPSQGNHSAFVQGAGNALNLNGGGVGMMYNSSAVPPGQQQQQHMYNNGLLMSTPNGNNIQNFSFDLSATQQSAHVGQSAQQQNPQFRSQYPDSNNESLAMNNFMPLSRSLVSTASPSSNGLAVGSNSLVGGPTNSTASSTNGLQNPVSVYGSLKSGTC